MNGMKPKFLENVNLPQSYYAPLDPYENPVQTKLNLREMSRYAEENGKKIAELTQEEIKKFII